MSHAALMSGTCVAHMEEQKDANEVAAVIPIMRTRGLLRRCPASRVAAISNQTSRLSLWICAVQDMAILNPFSTA